MSTKDVHKRPIDQVRDSAMSMKVGAPEDGEIKEMVGLKDRMLLILERAIYVMQLADNIDPKNRKGRVRNCVGLRHLSNGQRTNTGALLRVSCATRT